MISCAGGWSGSPTPTPRLRAFLDIHHLGVKSLALHDDEMLRLVDQWWPMETNVGRITCAELRERHGTVRYCATIDEFRQLAAVAAAQGMPWSTAATPTTRRSSSGCRSLDREHPGRPARSQRRHHPVRHPRPAEQLALRPFLGVAQRALDRARLRGGGARLRAGQAARALSGGSLRRFQQQLRETRQQVDEVWAEVLASFEAAEAETRPQLVLNYRNPLVRRVTGMREPDLVALAVQVLYGQALLFGHHPLRPADTALLNQSLLGLLDHAVGPGGPGSTRQEGTFS